VHTGAVPLQLGCLHVVFVMVGCVAHSGFKRVQLVETGAISLQPLATWLIVEVVSAGRP
jgi:rRNA pseudouridine-1189 N-methylase Emg1 (Nep1/Mra1 family)